MKKTLRVIIPLLLAVVVIGSAIWYLFSYDPNFTRDLLLSQARNFEKSGNHSAATWLYGLAYSHSGKGDDIAIELANYYKSIGNYTKAEYTLSNAIADGASTNLYIALCATYVEQDKLLDAVDMLDKIPNPQIKAELDAMRPAKPACSPDAGFYSQNLSITVESEDSTLYVSITGDHPSVETDLYEGPIALPVGESIVYAVAVSDNKLVSPWGVYGYTLGGIVEIVEFADTAMEAAIRESIGAGSLSDVYTDQLWAVTEFEVPAEAESYEDLALLTKLKTLTISNAGSKDLSMLSEIKDLETLSIGGGQLSTNTLKAIGTLSNLRSLTLTSCSLSTVAPLEGLEKLEYLDLSANTIRNITALSGMTELRELKMGSNALTDLSALTGLSKLSALDVSYNALTSLTPICSLPLLSELNASQNKLISVAGLNQLSNLTKLYLSHNSLTEINALSDCLNLTDLDVSYNEITDISAIGSMKNLLNLDMTSNEVTALPTFVDGCTLATIDASYNDLTSIEPLGKLASLNSVNVDHNSNLKSLKSLDNCPLLLLVNAYKTSVTEVTFLTDKGIVVNYIFGD